MSSPNCQPTPSKTYIDGACLQSPVSLRAMEEDLPPCATCGNLHDDYRLPPKLIVLDYQIEDLKALFNCPQVYTNFYSITDII